LYVFFSLIKDHLSEFLIVAREGPYEVWKKTNSALDKTVNGFNFLYQKSEPWYV